MWTLHQLRQASVQALGPTIVEFTEPQPEDAGNGHGENGTSEKSKDGPMPVFKEQPCGYTAIV